MVRPAAYLSYTARPTSHTRRINPPAAALRSVATSSPLQVASRLPSLWSVISTTRRAVGRKVKGAGASSMWGEVSRRTWITPRDMYGTDLHAALQKHVRVQGMRSCTSASGKRELKAAGKALSANGARSQENRVAVLYYVRSSYRRHWKNSLAITSLQFRRRERAAVEDEVSRPTRHKAVCRMLPQDVLQNQRHGL